MPVQYPPTAGAPKPAVAGAGKSSLSDDDEDPFERLENDVTRNHGVKSSEFHAWVKKGREEGKLNGRGGPSELPDYIYGLAQEKRKRIAAGAFVVATLRAPIVAERKKKEAAAAAERKKREEVAAAV